MSQNVLSVRNVSKRYKNGRGVFDIDFTLEEGEVFGLLGSNGAGKTTVMKMITGLLRPDSGEISVLDKDLFEMPEEALYEVGALIENPSFYPYLSAKENLCLAADYYKNKALGDAWITNVLEKVGLLPYQKERTANFSLGMKQRLGIALAMVSRPNLYILDEPSNGLDIEGRVEVRKIIQGIAREGNASFLISSHLSEEIEKTCTTVGIMKEGRLCTIEKMDKILSQYPNLEQYYLKQIGVGESLAS